jgi:hypothetical protein
MRITGFRLSLSTAQPVDQSTLPEMGTFYLLSDYLQLGDAPPYPFNPKPGLSTYLLAAPDVFVIDDTGIQFAGSVRASGRVTMNDDISPSDDGGDDDDPGTNAPPFTWPVALDGLMQVDPTNVPEACTAYLYQDQFTTNEDGEMVEPAPYPGIPEFAFGAPVYALTTNVDDTLFIVDDTGITRPEGGSPEPYISTNYPPGTFFLQITNTGGGFATLRVNGVVPGYSYELLSCNPSLGICWRVEKRFVADQDPAIFTVPIGSGSGLFWARQQNDLWLSLANQGDGTAILTIHNGEPDGVYDLFEISNLTDPSWAWTLRTSPGETAFSLPDLSESSRFFILAQTNNTDGDLMSDAWEKLVSHSDPTEPDAIGFSCNPASATVFVGDTAVLSATSQGPTPSFQWSVHGKVLSGVTKSALTLTNAQARDSGSYSVLEWNIMGSATGGPLTLTVIDQYVDTDGDGLSDYYETTVSHTDPAKWDTDGDGMSDGWEVAHGLNPLVNNQPYTPPATTVTITKPANNSYIQ